MAEKKYYWIKLKPTFFQSKEIKKLRKIAGGDTFVIIYLKMQLLSLETNGKLYFDGLEDDFSEELALILDEDSDNVRVTIAFLEKCGLIEQRADDEYFLPEALQNTGKESASAQRVRRHRALQCNEIPLQCNTDVTKCNTEKEIEIEKEIDIELEIEDSKGDDKSSPTPPKAKKFVKPSLKDVISYCKKRQNNVDPERFFNYYESIGWKVGKNMMKDWKAAVRTWESNNYSDKKDNSSSDMQKYEDFINKF